ncbi:MAG TPA: NAD(P)-dependent oxidoreductase [Aggregatilineales bacterium]|nr:NAD(P)-dependent oxidoreductase [Aggregatilineales bacterium]
MNVSVIGLGLMGMPIARNLVKAGNIVTVYNRTRNKSAELVSEGGGAIIAETVGQASHNEIVMTMLADDDALEAVAFGEGALLDTLPKGGIHVSMSTVSAAISERLTEAHRERGQYFVAAPVFGRPPAAVAGQLVIVAAGDPGAIVRCEELFKAISVRVFDMGTQPVAANVIKLTGNFMIASLIETMGEAFALVRKYDIAPDKFLDVLTNSLFASPVYKTYGGIIAHEQYEPAGFKLPLGLKDVRLAMAAAEAKNVALPVGSLVRDRFVTALALGYENKDWASIAEIIAHNAGLE